MLTHSEQIDQIASALADAQADLGIVFKQSQNDAFGSKYADLTRVWEAFQRVGPRHGLSVVQMPGHYDASARTMVMSVKLMHNSGQWLGGDMSMPLSRGDAHAYGSACTYARRYSLAALIGVCPHDDDGNEASGIVATFPARRPNSQAVSDKVRGAAISRPSLSQGSAPPAPPAKMEASENVVAGRGVPADPQGLRELRKLAAAAAVEEAALCQHYRVKALHELSPHDAARARRALKRKVQSLKGEAN
jgi:hypothetical protein